MLAGAVAIVAVLVVAGALARSFLDRRAAEDAVAMRAVTDVLRGMSCGLDGRQAVCDAAREITRCTQALLYEPGGSTGGLPTAPTATAGSIGAGAGDEQGRALLREAVRTWTEMEPRFVADAPGGALLLEPVVRDGAAAAVLCLRFAGTTSAPPRRRRAAMRLLAAEAATAIDRAESVNRVRAAERAEAANRLARDLHDSVTQEVAVAGLYTDMAKKALDEAEHEDARKLLCDATDQLARTQADLRGVLQSLRDGHRLDGAATLPELVDALAAEHERRADVPVSVGRDVSDWTRIPPEVADALYFAVREALHNALKHADGAPVRVELRADEELVGAIVRDEGPGFDPQQIPRGHWGLIGMRERAQRLGGWAHVTSRPGRGTTVTMALPREGRGGHRAALPAFP
jgi:signal transduction histidine kinase